MELFWSEKLELGGVGEREGGRKRDILMKSGLVCRKLVGEREKVMCAVCVDGYYSSGELHFVVFHEKCFSPLSLPPSISLSFSNNPTEKVFLLHFWFLLYTMGSKTKIFHCISFASCVRLMLFFLLLMTML